MGECRGGDWENVATHALFTSNPAMVSSGFRPGGLKRLEMLLLFFTGKTESLFVLVGQRCMLVQAILYMYRNKLLYVIYTR
jgi:hypothetical protein